MKEQTNDPHEAKPPVEHAMKLDTVKTALRITAACIITLAAALLILYKRPTIFGREIVSETSADSSYRFTVYQIGDPDFPFGSTHCRLRLTHNGFIVTEKSFDIKNDGAQAHEENFEIKWYDDRVTLTAKGQEQSDQLYTVRYNGKIE